MRHNRIEKTLQPNNFLLERSIFETHSNNNLSKKLDNIDHKINGNHSTIKELKNKNSINILNLEHNFSNINENESFYDHFLQNLKHENGVKHRKSTKKKIKVTSIQSKLPKLFPENDIGSESFIDSTNHNKKELILGILFD